MKKKWIFSLLGSMYALQLVFLVMCFFTEDEGSEKVMNACVGLIYFLIVVNLVLIVINFVSASGIYRKRVLPGQQQNAFRTVMIVKLSLIPYYIINFVIWLLVGLVASIPMILIFIGIILWAVIFLANCFTYLTILATSSYIIVQLIVLYRTKNISLIEFLIHTALQLVPIADVIDTVYLYSRYKKMISQTAQERQTIQQHQ